jgi:hypothetical protein
LTSNGFANQRQPLQHIHAPLKGWGAPRVPEPSSVSDGAWATRERGWGTHEAMPEGPTGQAADCLAGAALYRRSCPSPFYQRVRPTRFSFLNGLLDRRSFWLPIRLLNSLLNRLLKRRSFPMPYPLAAASTGQRSRGSSGWTRTGQLGGASHAQGGGNRTVCFSAGVCEGAARGCKLRCCAHRALSGLLTAEDTN